MAKEPGQKKSLHQLRQEIAHSRDRLARDVEGLKYELDFPLKFRKSFQRRTPIWVAAALLAGVVFTVRPAAKKKITVRAKSEGEETKKGLLQAGFAAAALKMVFTMLRPALMSFVTKQVGSYASRGQFRRQ